MNNGSEQQGLRREVSALQFAALCSARRGVGPMRFEEAEALCDEAHKTDSIIWWDIVPDDDLPHRWKTGTSIPPGVLGARALRWVLVKNPQPSEDWPVVQGIPIIDAAAFPLSAWDPESPFHVAPELSAAETPARVGFDAVEYPAHYNQGDIECVDAVRSQLTPEEFRGGCKQQAMQYIARERMKGGDQDLRKAIWWLRMAIGDDPRSYRKPPATTP